MSKARDRARRGVILLAVFGFIFSSVAITVLALMNSNNQDSTAQQQADLLKQLQEQQQCTPGEVADKKVDPAPAVPSNPVRESIPELSTEDVTVGTGAEVKEGDCVLLFFHGTLAQNGTAFQGGSNYGGGVPYRSTTTGFVPGFANGVVGMNVGGERRIFIPAAQGYGDQASGEIPANSDLIFTVKIVEVEQT